MKYMFVTTVICPVIIKSVAIATAAKLGYSILSEDKLFDTSGCSLESKEKKNAVAILATASACKFEESVTFAMGKEEWNKYFNSESFPNLGKVVLEKPEIEPAFYGWEKGRSLAEVQLQWERMALDIISESFA